MYAKIVGNNSLSNDWDIKKQVETFVWWNTRYRKSIPNLLKTQEDKWLKYQDECYFLMSRSGGPKKGLLTPHGFGLIDSDYYENPDNDGHFYFAYFNCSDHDIEVKKGDVIGQVIFQKFLVTDDDNASGERLGGFGSTD